VRRSGVFAAMLTVAEIEVLELPLYFEANLTT
jgi:hypothetical protein